MLLSTLGQMVKLGRVVFKGSVSHGGYEGHRHTAIAEKQPAKNLSCDLVGLTIRR